MLSNSANTFCEFFAGIGLVREGLASARWRCGYANDIDAKKRDGYRARFGSSDEYHLGDVWDTDAVVGRIHDRPALATASFPCIDLSVAGHYRGFGGAHSSAFFGFTTVLEALGERKPPLVLVENVVGFLTANEGRDFAAACQRLGELGYWLDAFVLDARHFTPQSRPRVFLVGMLADRVPGMSPRNGELWPDERGGSLRTETILQHKRTIPLPTGWVTLSLPEPPARRLQLAEVLDFDDEQPWWEEVEVRRHTQMMTDAYRRRLDTFLTDGTKWIGTAFRRIRNGAQRCEVRFDGLAGCLRTPKGGSARQIVVATIDGRLRMRWMTPREYARLQGAPEFPLVGTQTQQLWAFGDAVCVPAIRWIDRNVLTPLVTTLA